MIIFKFLGIEPKYVSLYDLKNALKINDYIISLKIIIRYAGSIWWPI